MKIDTLSVNNHLSYLKDTLTSSPDKNSFENKLNAALKEKDDKKLYAACQEMESVFLNKVLQSMRSTIPRSDFINHSFALDTFESMLFDEYAKKMGQNSSTGIADILYKQLNKK